MFAIERGGENPIRPFRMSEHEKFSTSFSRFSSIGCDDEALFFDYIRERERKLHLFHPFYFYFAAPIAEDASEQATTGRTRLLLPVLPREIALKCPEVL